MLRSAGPRAGGKGWVLHRTTAPRGEERKTPLDCSIGQAAGREWTGGGWGRGPSDFSTPEDDETQKRAEIDSLHPHLA